MRNHAITGLKDIWKSNAVPKKGNSVQITVTFFQFLPCYFEIA